MENKQALPEGLQEWAAQIDATRQPYIKLTPLADAVLGPAQSHLGGQPYWPLGLDYPTGANGVPLYLLIQLNFAEMPSLAPFPAEGLLQIFIADDALYGMDDQMSRYQENFRMIYHPEIAENDALLEDFSWLSEPERFPLPWGDEYPLHFEWTDGAAPAESPAFDRQLGEDFFNRFGDEKWAVMAKYQRYVGVSGHKIGGYAHFPQEDPREEEQTPLLLLQLDSDSRTGLNWGDRGTAHFFVDPADLLELNFSGTVFYNWSSY